jgi:Tfp pilus assembly protein PilX
MPKATNPINNQDGYLLLLSTIMLLALLTIISIAASRTASTEVQIAGNDLTYQRNFYLAEGAVMEAVDRLANDPNPKALSFVEAEIDTLTDANVKDYWDTLAQTVTATLDSSGKTRFVAGYEGTPPGYSLGMSKTKVHSFSIYGYTQKQGLSVIKVGYRMAF